MTREYEALIAYVEALEAGEAASVIMELRRFTTPRKTPPADGIISHHRTGRNGTHLQLSGRTGHRW
ncbi:hypothetical protein Q0Z83_045260 [Actinoplanes sichuanensis]|nr:hypothetical protein Q0Z83_045260 [Actinoplanes sichuanensis]